MAGTKRQKSSSIAKNSSRGRSSRGSTSGSKRYTPPVPASYKKSGRAMAITLFALLGAGFIVIFVDYLGVLPGGASNWYLLLGIALLAGGFYAATKYR